jgi:DNA-binding transcriptional regulator YiaG
MLSVLSMLSSAHSRRDEQRVESDWDPAKHEKTPWERGFDLDDAIRDEEIILQAIIRERLAMSQRRFAEATNVRVAALQNWEQGQTLMDPSARALMAILAREPEAALRALGHQRAA